MGVILTEVSKKALELIARRGRLHTYELVRTLDMKWSTAQDAIRRLERGNLIQFTGEEPGEKRPRRIYGLTVWGLGFALQQALCYGTEDWKAVEEIAGSNAKLWPLVLGRWKYFERMGVGEDARNRLLSTIVRFIGSPRAWDETGAKMDQKKGVERWTRYFFNRLTYWHADRRKWLRWCRALGEDPEIRKFMRMHLNKNVREFRLAMDKHSQYLCDILRFKRSRPTRGHQAPQVARRKRKGGEKA
jgi:hypothetical protein